MRQMLDRLGRAVGSWPRDLLIGIVAGGLLTPALALLTEHKVRLWVLALAVAAAFVTGRAIGTLAGTAGEGESLKARIKELESRTGELGEYETYAEHVRDALGELRKVVSKELESVSTRDFIEVGIFEPAHRLLQREHRAAARGDVRFSILVPDGDDFVMADDSGLQPAHGHRPESRQEFRLPIKDAFAGVAYNTGRVQSSSQLSSDDRFKRHPKASPDRAYESMVSVPLLRRGEVDGVLNVLAARNDAFSPVDRTYITLLASVIDVARSLDASR